MDLDGVSHKDLLDARFCDLPIGLEGTPVARRAARVFGELEARRLKARPSIWLSEEWFNPDGVVGFAIPFYLAHPRLVELERRMMLEAEGASEGECLRILRHETGHAIDEAYQLYRTPEYVRTFGSPRRGYPSSYDVEPGSRDYVVHLNAWYAQSHPVEDFAETFAMWLRPKRLWRRQYRDWPALEKLETVDRWMSDWAGEAPAVADQGPVEPLEENERTLAEHYEEKRAFYGVDAAAAFDNELRRIFSVPEDAGNRRLTSAVSVLRTIRTPMRKQVARPLGVPAYTVDQVLRRLIARARALNLKHARPTEDAIADVLNLVSHATMDILQDKPRLPL